MDSLPKDPTPLPECAREDAGSEKQNSKKAGPEPPKLTAAEFRVYNRLAELMDRYHNHFRATWNLLMGACESGKRPKGMSIRQFISTGESFISGLTMHHNIEEEHIYPLLARKMPAFKQNVTLIGQHREIHKGLDKMEDYFRECRTGERELRLSELKDVMESFGEVLWRHLDEEVVELGAEKMRAVWTLEEMRRLPF